MSDYDVVMPSVHAPSGGRQQQLRGELSCGAETTHLRHKQLLSSSSGQSQMFGLGLKAPCFRRTAARELDYNDNDDHDGEVDNDNCNDGMTMVDGYDNIYDENDNCNDNIDNDNYGDYDPTL